MSLTAISSLESARTKIFHELDVHHIQKSRNQTFLGSGSRNESNCYQLARIGEKKIFHELDVHHVQKVGIKRFSAKEGEMSSGGRNESNSNQLAAIGEKKIFHKFDVHHVQTVGIKRFWAQQVEISLTAMSSPNRQDKNFFMNSTYIMSRKQESNVFGLRRPK